MSINVHDHRRWEIAWSLLASVTFVVGLFVGLRVRGAVDTAGAMLLVAFVAASLTTSLARAVEFPFRWSLIGWPLLGSAVAVAAVNVLDQFSWLGLLPLVALAVTSPWAIELAFRRLGATELAHAAPALDGPTRELRAPERRVELSRSDVDARFEDIVSRL